MNRQSVMAFSCHMNTVAETTMRYAGGFEIVSVSHAHHPGMGGMVGGMLSVVLVIHGPADQLRDHEAKVSEWLGTDVTVVT